MFINISPSITLFNFTNIRLKRFALEGPPHVFQAARYYKDPFRRMETHVGPRDMILSYWEFLFCSIYLWSKWNNKSPDNFNAGGEITFVVMFLFLKITNKFNGTHSANIPKLQHLQFFFTNISSNWAGKIIPYFVNRTSLSMLKFVKHGQQKKFTERCGLTANLIVGPYFLRRYRMDKPYLLLIKYTSKLYEIRIKTYQEGTENMVSSFYWQVE